MTNFFRSERDLAYPQQLVFIHMVDCDVLTSATICIKRCVIMPWEGSDY